MQFQILSYFKLFQIQLQSEPSDQSGISVTYFSVLEKFFLTHDMYHPCTIRKNNITTKQMAGQSRMVVVSFKSWKKCTAEISTHAGFVLSYLMVPI